MSEPGWVRRRPTLDESIDAALREIAAGEAPSDLRARVIRRLESRGEDHQASGWHLRWLAVSTAGAVALVALVLFGLLPGPGTTAPPRDVGSQAGAPASAAAAAYPSGTPREARGSLGGVVVDQTIPTAPGVSGILRAASLLGVSLLMPALRSRGADLAAALAEDASVEIEAIDIPPIAVAPIPPPDPVVIDAIDISPIVVAPIDIPVLQVKPLDAGTSTPRSADRLRQQ